LTDELAISGSDLSVPLYRITEVREITRKAFILAKSAMSASVIPSEKYSCWGSFERSSKGTTAIDWIRRGVTTQADLWDIEQQIHMTPQERRSVAEELRRRVYGESPPDVRETTVTYCGEPLAP